MCLQPAATLALLPRPSGTVRRSSAGHSLLTPGASKPRRRLRPDPPAGRASRPRTPPIATSARPASSSLTARPWSRRSPSWAAASGSSPRAQRRRLHFPVNRGIVPPDRADPATRPASGREGHVAVTGLLRLSEPGGAFLRLNDPVSDRWFSRDVATLAQARGSSTSPPVSSTPTPIPAPGRCPCAPHRDHLPQQSHGLCDHLVQLASLSLAGLAVLFRPGRPAVT